MIKPFMFLVHNNMKHLRASRRNINVFLVVIHTDIESFKALHSIMSVTYGREAVGVSEFTEQGSSLHIN